MIKLAANLHFMFTELPFLDRIDAAAGAGFRGVEVFLLGDLPVQDLLARLEHNNLQLVQLYANPGAFEAGEVGVAIFERRIEEFRDYLLQAIDDACHLNCELVSCLIGKGSQGPRTEHERTVLLRNLEWASDACANHGITLLVEPISNQGPEYFLRHTAEARALIDAVGSPHIKLLYDTYHAQMLEGNLTQTILANLDVLGHIQVADVPGRHEPGSGEINYTFLLRTIAESGYGGWIGCEYKPIRSTSAGLQWAAPYL